MTNQTKRLLAYYGDDFTGSTDALEFMSRVGAKTVLFMEPPSPDRISRYEPLNAIGVAGQSRTMTPKKMEQELYPTLTALKKLNTQHVHYKVCSTFDSSPTIGSIGKAIDLAAEIFDSKFIPLLVAAPALGRYCTFGNLFAQMGIGSDGEIYRLDRHPSMNNHPITPADESDLRLHLRRQTDKGIGLVDILEIAKDDKTVRETVEERIRTGAEVVLFDAIKEKEMTSIGRLMDHYGRPDSPLFSVGSSGIEMALGDHWIKEGMLNPREDWDNPGKAEPMLVVSGSRSPVTSAQINWAVSNGFEETGLDTEALAEGNDTSSVIEHHIEDVLNLLSKGKNVIIHTSFGMKDPRVEATKAIFNRQGLSEIEILTLTARLFGTALGRIIKETVEQTSLQRVVFAGGDTSSYAARALDIESLEMIAPVTPGAPLCKVNAPGSSLDGLEVNIKGGQVGSKEYFGTVLEGKAVP